MNRGGLFNNRWSSIVGFNSKTTTFSSYNNRFISTSANSKLLHKRIQLPSDTEQIDEVIPKSPRVALTISEVKNFSPDQIKVLHEQIIKLSRPQFRKYHWNQPELSQRQIGETRKKFILAGIPFPEIPKNHKIKKGKTRNPITMNPKGHIHQRNQLERLKQIEANMVKMPKLIEDIRRASREKQLAKVVEPTLWDVIQLPVKPKELKKKVKAPSIRKPGEHFGGHRIFYKKK